MRITIKYLNGHPELETDLAAFAPRDRAERLRMLASIGLSILKSPHQAPRVVVNKASSVALKISEV